MDLFFNELSIKDKDGIDHDSVRIMVIVYKELLKHNVTTCRISHEDNVKLFQMISKMSNSVNVRNFYFSFFRSPYESESVEKNQEDYWGHSWTHEGDECIGLALAVLLDSAVFSIYSSSWNIPFIEILKDASSSYARNICVNEHVSMHIPQLLGEAEAELVRCDLQSFDKKIVLRNDHGKDVLEDFSKRLVQCPYLVGIVNSLPYNPYERKFIKKVRENGLIEIVLPWTDKGYGIVVKTTGRTLRETEKIAEIIQEEYGYL